MRPPAAPPPQRCAWPNEDRDRTVKRRPAPGALSSRQQFGPSAQDHTELQVCGVVHRVSRRNREQECQARPSRRKAGQTPCCLKLRACNRKTDPLDGGRERDRQGLVVGADAGAERDRADTWAVTLMLARFACGFAKLIPAGAEMAIIFNRGAPVVVVSASFSLGVSAGTPPSDPPPIVTPPRSPESGTSSGAV